MNYLKLPTGLMKINMVDENAPLKKKRTKKIFNCQLCGNRFSENSKLARHIASVHEKKQPYSCNLCDGTFASNQHLKGHISSVHDGLKPHSCDMCNASFDRKSHLKRHQNKFHGV